MAATPLSCAFRALKNGERSPHGQGFKQTCDARLSPDPHRTCRASRRLPGFKDGQRQAEMVERRRCPGLSPTPPPLNPAQLDFAVAEKSRRGERTRPPARRCRAAQRPADEHLPRTRGPGFSQRRRPSSSRSPARSGACSVPTRGSAVDFRVPRRTRRIRSAITEAMPRAIRSSRTRNPLRCPPHRREQTKRQ